MDISKRAISITSLVIFLTAAALPALLAAAGLLSCSGNRNKESETVAGKTKRLETGSPAPDFTVGTFDGKTLALSELTGKGPVVLVFIRGFS